MLNRNLVTHSLERVGFILFVRGGGFRLDFVFSSGLTNGGSFT